MKCECGCGEDAPVALRSRGTSRPKGPQRFIRGHAVRGRRIGREYELPELSDFDLGWLAGIYEGEGSVGIRVRERKGGVSVGVQVQLSSTDKDMIERLHALIPGSTRCVQKMMPGRKRVYKWNISKVDLAIKFLKCIHPYLSVRRQDQIDRVLEQPSYLGR